MNFSSFSRRLTTALFVGGLGLTASHIVHAAPSVPPVNQAPGFFRMAVGDHVVTALYDGYVSMPPKLLNGNQQQIETLMTRMFQNPEAPLDASVNAFLVHTATNLVLIDAGTSDCFGPNMGRLMESIKSAGYKPEDVDTVLITHMHPDHFCGITSTEGKANFPNATVWAGKADADFWLDAKSTTRLPTEQHAFITMAQNAVAPYAAISRFKPLTGAEEIVPGIRVVPSAGHTPGHTAYLVSSGSANMLVWGDTAHFHAVQLPHPEVTIAFDVDQKNAFGSRQRLLDKAAQNGWLVATAHHPFPGIGHVRREGEGYEWVPVEYTESSVGLKR